MLKRTDAHARRRTSNVNSTAYGALASGIDDDTPDDGFLPVRKQTGATKPAIDKPAPTDSPAVSLRMLHGGRDVRARLLARLEQENLVRLLRFPVTNLHVRGLN